jgi:hypothetical protein
MTANTAQNMREKKQGRGQAKALHVWVYRKPESRPRTGRDSPLAASATRDFRQDGRDRRRLGELLELPSFPSSPVWKPPETRNQVSAQSKFCALPYSQLLSPSSRLTITSTIPRPSTGSRAFSIAGRNRRTSLATPASPFVGNRLTEDGAAESPTKHKSPKKTQGAKETPNTLRAFNLRQRQVYIQQLRSQGRNQDHNIGPCQILIRVQEQRRKEGRMTKRSQSCEDVTGIVLSQSE